MKSRPRPPSRLVDASGEDAVDRVRSGRYFEPAPELIEWAVETFIAEGAPLENIEHAHLRYARIAALWTAAPNSRYGRPIVGQAEFTRNGVGGSQGKWAKARVEQQVMEWFGFVPDFILTFDARYAAACSDAELCALVEHELLHCGQERDEFGAPRFSKSSGLPAFCICGHDVEEFVSIVRRYGADAAHVRAMIEAAAAGPEIAPASIASACGTCLS
jgi:Putative phage metallopeptidase